MVDDAADPRSAADTDTGAVTGERDVDGDRDGDSGRRDAADRSGGSDRGGDPDARSVVVPTRVYKAVTVFSTLFAVVTVVGGFVVLDVATERASVALSEVDPLLALAGVGLIVVGAVTYAFSTRFRAAGMGNAKDDTDEPSRNG